MLETSDRLMLYQGEPIKPTRCCFDHSCHDPFPRGPMKNAFSIRALTERWRRCNRQSIRCTCITRLRLNSSMAAPASILRCCAAAARCCFLCYCCRGLVCCQLLVPLVFVFRQFKCSSYCYRAGSLLWNADAAFSLLVLKTIIFEDLSCISVEL